MTNSPTPGPRYRAPGVSAGPVPASIPAPIIPARLPSRALTWGVSLGTAASGLTVASQGLALAQGPQVIRAAVDELVSSRSGSLATLVDAAVDGAYQTLQARAALSTGLAGAAVVPLLLVLRAGILPRIAAVALMALNGLVLMVCVLDVFPQTARAVGVLAIGLQPVAAALLFVPAVGGSRRTHAAPARHVGAPLVPVLTADGGSA